MSEEQPDDFEQLILPSAIQLSIFCALVTGHLILTRFLTEFIILPLWITGGLRLDY